MCWRLRKLLFCWSLMCSGWLWAKSFMLIPPASSPSHSLPWIKCSYHMGIALIAWVALDHSLAAPRAQQHVAGIFLKALTQIPLCRGLISCESFLASWLMNIPSSLDHWLR